MRVSPYRLWYYFRFGHGTYLGLALAFIQFLTIEYTLAIARLPFLEGIHFWEFTAIFTIFYSVAAVFIGWLHKRFQMSVETDIAVLTNPYTYKVIPGRDKEFNMPLSVVMLQIFRGVAKANGFLTPELDDRLTSLEIKAEVLTSGEELR